MFEKIKIKIEGLHCESCKVLIETELGAREGVKAVSVDYATGQCDLEFDDAKISQERIFKAIEKLNYKVVKNSSEKKGLEIRISNNMVIAVILLLVFVVGYFLIKNLGYLSVLSRLNENNIGYWLIFIIGLLASFHCVGMCGGLVVAYTTKHQIKNNGKASSLPHFQYNLGRVISYSLIGGVLGGFGSFFAINPTFTGIVTLVAGGFMILMGLSLVTNSKWLDKIKLKTPLFIARFLFSQKRAKKPKGPFIVGLLNGLMPCGPLQAMQLYALASGSIMRGALSMGIYALGTVPLMFGFGKFISLISQEKIKYALKISGIIVIILGVFMLNRGFVNFGYGMGSIVPRQTTSQILNTTDKDAKGFQTVKMDLTFGGYSPNLLYIKRGVPARWIINVKQMSGCTNEIIMPEYNIRKKLKYGENIIEFTPKKVGEIKFSCWMKMVWGKFIVVE
ncbi:MAG: heavy metal transport/detoxification protein [Parcubacteria group bacterium CG10_big_fil_rev_8_21_14_0_10_36_14]|nr:MAG: heavy metal transport/detoxification protein [Parcubacteria group bacterium CG10_big_fil_rev_8_21_14_0_10_36_14]